MELDEFLEFKTSMSKPFKRLKGTARVILIEQWTKEFWDIKKKDQALRRGVKWKSMLYEKP